MQCKISNHDWRAATFISFTEQMLDRTVAFKSSLTPFLNPSSHVLPHVRSKHYSNSQSRCFSLLPQALRCVIDLKETTGFDESTVWERNLKFHLDNEIFTWDEQLPMNFSYIHFNIAEPMKKSTNIPSFVVHVFSSKFRFWSRNAMPEANY